MFSHFSEQTTMWFPVEGDVGVEFQLHLSITSYLDNLSNLLHVCVVSPSKHVQCLAQPPKKS